MNTRGRSTRNWKRLCAELKALLPPVCAHCGKGIDLSLHHLDKWAWTLDHVLARDTHPHLAEEPSNLVPMHRSCNSSLGNKTKRSSTNTNTPRVSRRWV